MSSLVAGCLSRDLVNVLYIGERNAGEKRREGPRWARFRHPESRRYAGMSAMMASTSARRAGAEGALRLLVQPAQLFAMVREALGERFMDHLGTAATHELRELREGAILVGGEQSVDIIANLQSFNNRADKIDARGGRNSSA